MGHPDPYLSSKAESMSTPRRSDRLRSQAKTSASSSSTSTAPPVLTASKSSPTSSTRWRAVRAAPLSRSLLP